MFNLLLNILLVAINFGMVPFETENIIKITAPLRERSQSTSSVTSYASVTDQKCESLSDSGYGSEAQTDLQCGRYLYICGLLMRMCSKALTINSDIDSPSKDTEAPKDERIPVSWHQIRMIITILLGLHFIDRKIIQFLPPVFFASLGFLYVIGAIKTSTSTSRALDWWLPTKKWTSARTQSTSTSLSKSPPKPFCHPTAPPRSL